MNWYSRQNSTWVKFARNIIGNNDVTVWFSGAELGSKTTVGNILGWWTAFGVSACSTWIFGVSSKINANTTCDNEIFNKISNLL